MPSAANGGQTINFFETGYIIIGNKRFDVEEISVNASRDMTPYHVASQRDPIDQRPGKNKIEFSMKRAFSDAILGKMYDSCCVFSLLLINNDNPLKPQQIMLLEGCRLTQDNIGPINGSDVVSEDLSGVARRRVWKTCSIANALDETCDLSCPDDIKTGALYAGSYETEDYGAAFAPNTFGRDMLESADAYSNTPRADFARGPNHNFSQGTGTSGH